MKLSNRFHASMARVFVVPGALVLALLCAQAAGQEGAMKAPPSTPESVAAGKAVFFEYCSGCHGRRADGRGPQSLNLEPRPQNLRNAPFVAYLTDDRLYGSISGGVRGTAMPAFELMITGEKRWQVIHYIRSLTAGDRIAIPNGIASVAVPADARNPLVDTVAAVAGGKGVWLSYCASCHGSRGDGKGLLAESLAPRPRNLVAVVSWGEKPFIDYLTDSRLFDSISNGVPGTSMGPWVGVLTDTERWSVISYLRDCGRSERQRTEQQ
jgi:mono/diheme cytochrome c family protein